jgi:hypothetical protein
VDKEEISDNELDKELEKAFKESENRRDVFKIIRNEKESLELKEKRLKKKNKY